MSKHTIRQSQEFTKNGFVLLIRFCEVQKKDIRRGNRSIKMPISAILYKQFWKCHNACSGRKEEFKEERFCRFAGSVCLPTYRDITAAPPSNWQKCHTYTVFRECRLGAKRGAGDWGNAVSKLVLLPYCLDATRSDFEISLVAKRGSKQTPCGVCYAARCRSSVDLDSSTLLLVTLKSDSRPKSLSVAGTTS